MGLSHDPVRVTLAALPLFGIHLMACTTSQQWQLGVPGTRFDLQVTRVEERGSYLDVSLAGDGLTLRSFTSASAECARVLAPERTVTWIQDGLGRFERDGAECKAVGIGTLEEWRDRGRETPSLTASPVPSAQSTYRVVYRDEDVALLRGRFPLADQIGWVGLDDSIAVVPRGEASCEDVLRRNVGTLEYFARGTPVLALMGPDARCPIVGLVRPSAPPEETRPR